MDIKMIISNIFKNKFFRNVFVIITVLLLIVPIILYNKVSTTFNNEILSNINNDAEKIAKHVHSRHFETTTDIELNKTINNIVSDFDIYKIKFFDSNGIVLNSTEAKEIGNKNKYDYFYDKVVKGKVYYHLVQKGMLSLEGKMVTKDVVEIYIPIMKNDEFKGAFELYYDVTENCKEALDAAGIEIPYPHVVEIHKK